MPTARLDGWGNPLLVVNAKDGSHCLVMSAGSDGRFEADVGGPTPRWETDRDIVFIDGEPFQWPEGIQEQLSRSEIMRQIELAAAPHRARWTSEELAALRSSHAELLLARR
jgi:hypothetical protein